MTPFEQQGQRGNMEIMIRSETASDYRKVEEITREAFWNLYTPGCNEHYLVHIMRHHPDFIPNLDFVALVNEAIVGNIMYMKSSVVNEKGDALDTITFGPVSVLPGYQKRGIGAALIQYSLKKAIAENHNAVIIYGHPYNYCKHGFKCSRDFNVSTIAGKYPSSLLVLELKNDVLKDHSWKYIDSVAYALKDEEVEAFDATFEPKEKGYRYTQEEFSISLRSFLE